MAEYILIIVILAALCTCYLSESTFAYCKSHVHPETNVAAYGGKKML